MASDSVFVFKINTAQSIDSDDDACRVKPEALSKFFYFDTVIGSCVSSWILSNLRVLNPVDTLDQPMAHLAKPS